MRIPFQRAFVPMLLAVFHLPLVAGELPAHSRRHFYVQPRVEISRFNHRTVSWYGLSAGTMVTPKFGLGAEFMSLGSAHVVERTFGPQNESRPYQATLAYAGVRATYVPKPSAVLRGAFDLVIADGWIGLVGPADFYDMRRPYMRDRFMLVKPAARIEYALSRVVQLTSGFSYAFTRGIDHFGFTDHDVGGVMWNTDLTISTF